MANHPMLRSAPTLTLAVIVIIICCKHFVQSPCSDNSELWTLTMSGMPWTQSRGLGWGRGRVGRGAGKVRIPVRGLGVCRSSDCYSLLFSSHWQGIVCSNTKRVHVPLVCHPWAVCAPEMRAHSNLSCQHISRARQVVQPQALCSALPCGPPDQFDLPQV